MKKQSWLSACAILFSCAAFAQTTVNHPYNTGAQSFTVATGAYINYYDNGGTSSYSNYSDPVTSIVTFAPSQPTQKIQVTFTSFSTENTFDALYIYNGNVAETPDIANTGVNTVLPNQFNSGASQANTFRAGGFQGGTSPGTVTSTAASGALTFQFDSDYVVTGSGWVATVTGICDPIGANDAGVAAIDTFTQFCPGSHPIYANVQNFGTNAVTSVTVEWLFDGVAQTPVLWNSGSLDTCNGTGSNAVAVFLGNKTFNAGATHLVKAWTTMPNGVPDTVNANDTIEVELIPGLAGTYTVGGASPDFVDFSEAVDALVAAGVCDTVIFNVRNGTYNEQISIPAIASVDSLHPVIFQSEAGDSSLVILSHSANSSANYTLRLNGADWFFFKELTVEATNTTYGRVVEITGGSHHVHFSNCLLDGVSTTSTGNNLAVVYSPGNSLNHHVSFKNNRFRDGSQGLDYEGNYNGGNYLAGLTVEDNVFENQYYKGIYLNYQSHPLLRRNLVQSNTNYSNFFGVHFYDTENGGEIVANKVQGIANGGYGIIVEYAANLPADPLLVANNFVQMSGENQAIGIYTAYGEWQNFTYNTVHLATGNTSSRVFQNYYGSDKSLKNNVFAATGDGVAIESYGSLSASDHNDLFAAGNEFGYLDGIFIPNLAAWQAVTLLDSNSVSVNPDFAGASNFHVSAIELNAAAVPAPPVTLDLDGETRHATTPDIGADEFTPPANDAKLTVFTSPVPPFPAGSTPVDVVLKNNGSATLTSATVNWQINAVAQTAVNWTGSLASGQSDTVTLGNFTFDPGVAYDLLAISSLPNGVADPNPANDTAQVNDIYAALAGVYTIGGASPDFLNFTEAIEALHLRGVSDSVTFNVRNGTYSEQIAINPVLGASAANPVIFQSESGDSSLVTLTSAPNWPSLSTLTLNGADWLTFSKLTIEVTSYGRAVRLDANADHNTWSHCHFKGVDVLSSAYEYVVVLTTGHDEFNTFENNRFVNGSTGLYYEGNYDTSYTEGVQILNNVFENQYFWAIHARELHAPVFDGNVIFSDSPYSGFIGIYPYYCFGNTTVTNNQIYGLANGGTGIYLGDVNGDVDNQCLVANNFIRVGGSVDETWGLYSYFGQFQNFVYNTVHVDNTHANSRAFLAYCGSDKTLLNNVLANIGGGRVIEQNCAGNIVSSDYNDLFTTGASIASIDGVYHATLSDWQTASSLDANSFSADPGFVALDSFAVTAVELDGSADPTPLVTLDIEGETRSATAPDIGADEFTAPSVDAALLSFTSPTMPFAPGVQNVSAVLKNNGTANLVSATLKWQINGANQDSIVWVGNLASGATTAISLGTPTFNAGTFYDLKAWSLNPNGSPDPYPANDTIEVNDLISGLAGVYTVGGTTPDFSNFTAAVDALHAGGVVGAVTFNVRNGTYSEQISINQILGVDSLKNVTFQSESGDSSAVVLAFSSTSSANNYVLKINGADWMNFRKMTVQQLSTNYGFSTHILNGSHHLEFTNNAIKTADLDYTNVYVADDQPNYNLIFRNNDFLMGYNGIAHAGHYNNGSYVGGFVMEDNIFRSQFNAGVWMRSQNHPVIRGNVIYGMRTGIYVYDSYFSGEITGNHIYNITINGILSEFFSGTVSEPLLIANNFVHVAGTGSVYGIYTYYGDYLNIYHNSVHLTNTQAGSRAYYNVYGSNKRVRNNIFANTGGGYAYYNNNASSIVESNRNDLFTTGANLGYWNGNRANLAAWQSASGMDANSISIHPGYLSNTDLHTNIAALNAAASPLASVPTDFDGDTRDPATPDIGADEFSISNEDAGVASIDAPVEPFPAGNQAVMVTIFNNGLDTLESVTVNWEVNGASQTPLNWTGSLLTGASADSINIGSFVFEVDTTYDVRAWTSLPNGIADTLNLNDTSAVNDLHAALSGTYTIGGTTPDFPDFQSAVDAMIAGGVVGAVTFNVRTGEYEEQISIPQITGASMTNTVTFQSESGDSTDAVLKFGASTNVANYVLQLNGADWFRFKKMTVKNTATGSYTAVVFIGNGATNNLFENNEIVGYNTTSTSTNNALFLSGNTQDNNNGFLNNRLLEGSYGFYLYGSGTNSLESGTVIQGNVLEGQYYQGVYLVYQNAPWVIGNDVSSTNPYYYFNAIYGNYCQNNYKFTHNYVHDQSSGTGIEINNSTGTSSLRGLLANNFISVGDGTNTYAYGITVQSCSFQDLVHNNVNVFSTSAGSSIAFYNSGGSNLAVKNNVFAATGNGYSFYKSSGTLTSDYNDLFTSAGANLGYWQGSNLANLSAWQTTTSQDDHSYSVDPEFTSNSDLHVEEVDLNNTGTPLAAVTDDFDGETRSATTPDIGADEFSPIVFDDASVVEIYSPRHSTPFPSGVQSVEVVLKNSGANVLNSATIGWRANGLAQAGFSWTGSLASGARDTVVIGAHNFTPGFGHDITAWSSLPNSMADNNPDNDTSEVEELWAGLSGTYTIGGAFPDFQNFTAAATALNNGGVLGAVTFNVRNGTYDETVSINQINGAGATNTIVFQSQNGDSSLVKLRNVNSYSPDYVVQLNGADYVTFQKMTFQTTGCCIGSIFYFTNRANNNKLLNCRLTHVNSNGNYLVHSSGSYLDNNNQVENNRLENGGYGIYWYGQSQSLLESGNTFINNVLVNQQYEGIVAYYQNAPRVERNSVATNSTYNSFDGIHLGYCDNAVKVLRNQVDIPNGYGLRLYRCDGTSANRVLVANNFIHVGGSVAAYGIYSDYGYYQNIHFNNVHLTNSATGSASLQAYPSGNYNFLNNVFANSGGGFAANVNGGFGVASSNFNDLFATGTNLGQWDGSNAANLTAWRTLSGKDANSVSANPLFYADNDLHVLQVALDSAATPVSGIGTDFDGEARSAGQPDIGADEFDYLTDDLGITQLVEPQEDCNLGMATVKVLIQNFGGLPQTGFNVAYRLNGAAQVLENVGALSVPPGGTATYTFATPANLSAYVEHDFELYTLLTGDLNLPNDTLAASVQNFQTPAVPGNMLPANGTLNVDPPVNFSWLPSAGATRYDLYVWKQGDPEPASPSAADITQITYAYDIANWVYGATYNWKLVAKNNHCSTPSGTQSFTLRELPDLVVQNVQPPGMPFSGQSIEVAWEVHNMGLGNTGMTTWYDYVYLSADNIFQPGIDDYLGGFANFTALTGGGEYSNMKNVTLPNGISGTFYLFVVADQYNNLLEGNNNNNVSPAASMVVTLTPPPDLQVTGFITPSTVFSGTNVNVSWTVSNEGPGNVPTGNYFWDHVYFSSSPAYDPGTATYVGSYYSSPINSGASNQRTISIQIPNGIFGNHYVHVRTDIYNYVFEHAFESNNTGNSNPINVILTPPPNLKVTSVGAPDPLDNHQAFTLNWTTANQGATAATGGFSDRVYVSSSPTWTPGGATQLGTFGYGATLNAGASVARSATVTVPGNLTGTQYFYVETDVYNNVYEYNLEGDNVSTGEPATIQNADLTVTGVSAPGTVQSGSEVSVNWTVKNNGVGDLLGINRSDRVYLSTSPTYNPATATHVGTLTYNNPLPAGDSILRQVNVTIPNGISGARYLHVATDFGNDVFENTGENNNANSASTFVNLSPWADLRVDTMTGLPDTTVAGTVLNLSFTVKNHGLGDVQGISGGWKDRVYISPNPVWNINTAVLLKTVDQLLPVAAGANYSGSTSFVLPMLGGGAQTGVCYIYVFTDATDKIFEHVDEGNNTKRSHPLYVSAPDPVDFEAIATTTLPDTLDSGETANLQWSVRNNGNPTTLWNYALWYDGVYFSTDSLFDEYDDLFVKDFTKQAPLLTDEAYSKNENFQVPNGISGNYYAFLTADHTELTNDGDETNNWRRIRPASFPAGAAKPVYVKLSPSPDLKPTAMVAPSSGVSGQPIQVIWTVKNEGVGTTSGSWTDRFYLSTDFAIGNNDPIVGSKTQTRTLTTGQFYQDTMEVFIPISSVGNFVLIFKTDAGNGVFEFNGEGNNEFFTYLTASLPLPSDLVVNSVSFGNMAMVGEPFSVTYNLKNQGTNPATGTMSDIVYFSADSAFDAMDVPYLGPFHRAINVAPNGNLSATFTGTTPGVPLGDYFIVTQTDALNNIFESSETNNLTVSTSKVTVSVKELPLGVLTPDTLENEVNLYYRVQIDSANLGETMRISLDGHTAQSVNELYVSFNEVPTRSDHDFSFPNPFTSDQAITVPEVQVGQYYLLAYGSTLIDTEQDVDLKAEIIPFQISAVDANQGGNTGNVTVRVDGAKFTADMEVRLFDAALGEVVAHSVYFVNSTRVYATFNLAGKALGTYDVVAEKSSPAATTGLPNGFAIVAGAAGTGTNGSGGGGGFFCNIVNVGAEQHLQKNIAHPASIRVNRVAPITIQFGNDGDVDIPCPTRWLISLRGAPISFTVDGLEENKQELYLNFMEQGGPPGILRPGSYSSITVYAYSSHAMRFVLRE